MGFKQVRVMVEKIKENIYRLPIPLPKNPLGELNSYFIKGGNGERNLLIDTGFGRPECKEALLACLDELSVRMEETDIMLTHMHSDHTGLAPAIAGDETHVYVSEKDRIWMVEPMRGKMVQEEYDHFFHQGFSQEAIDNIGNTHPGWKFSPDLSFTRYEAVEEGHTFNVGGYELSLVAVPGHTPGQMCLWEADHGILFSADHVLFDITPNITSWPNLPNSLGTYLESLDKIDAYPVQMTLPGHRKTGDIHERIAELKEHHRIRLTECLNVIKANPGITAYDTTGLMSWNIRYKDWSDFPDSQRWFAVGECQAHINLLLARGDIRMEESGGVDHYFV